jgi:hypothetical protein
MLIFLFLKNLVEFSIDIWFFFQLQKLISVFFKDLLLTINFCGEHELWLNRLKGMGCG